MRASERDDLTRTPRARDRPFATAADGARTSQTTAVARRWRIPRCSRFPRADGSPTPRSSPRWRWGRSCAASRTTASPGASRATCSRGAAASFDSALARVGGWSAHDRLALAASRNARDLSKVSTRVRLVRRELAHAEEGRGGVGGARSRGGGARRAGPSAGEELRVAQRTVGALQGVTAKQFGALAKALTNVKGEVDASKAPTEGSHSSTSEAESFVERDANVTRVRRRRSLTFRVGGDKKSFFSETRASAAAGDDSDPAAGEDEAASESP